MTTTTNLGLQKPAESDALGASLAAFNANTDKLDAAFAQVQNKAAKAVATQATLLASEWSGCIQIAMNVTGVTESTNLIITPDPDDYVAYNTAVVRRTAQGNKMLGFICDEEPTQDLKVNVLILG